MQTTDTVIMIAPTEFRANSDACADNYFADAEAAFDRIAVLNEAGSLKTTLTAANIKVIEFDPAALPNPPNAPDGCFPNNWLMFVDGKAILCPMKSASRRSERLMWPFISERLQQTRVVSDLTSWESEGLFLEGTGSLVLDRVNRIAFAALSERTILAAAERVADLLDYQLVAFDARDPQGRAIYHTNVLMSIGSEFAVLCSEVISPVEEQTVRNQLSKYREIVDITWNQVLRYCGNVLELSAGDSAIVAMSKTAYEGFTQEQLERFRAFGAEPVFADVSTIERVAGGSVRCMLAEVF